LKFVCQEIGSESNWLFTSFSILSCLLISTSVENQNHTDTRKQQSHAHCRGFLASPKRQLTFTQNLNHVPMRRCFLAVAPKTKFFNNKLSLLNACAYRFRVIDDHEETASIITTHVVHRTPTIP